MLEEYAMICAAENDPDEETAKALTELGDLQKKTGKKSKAQINWTSANHSILLKLQAQQSQFLLSVGDFATRCGSRLGDQLVKE